MFSPFAKKPFELTEKIAVLSLAGMIFALIMTLPISKFVWESLPFIEFIQYPWRFINFIALFASILVAYLIFVLRKHFGTKTVYIFCLFTMGLTLVFNGKLFVPQQYNAYSPEYYDDRNYVRFTVSKISDEYLPFGFQKPQQISDLPKSNAEFLKSNASIEFVKIREHQYLIKYSLSRDDVIHVNRAYYPSWEAILNGERLPIVSTSDGMNISVKAGSGTIQLKLRSTPMQALGNTLTIFSILIFLAVIMYPRYKQKLSNTWFRKG